METKNLINQKYGEIASKKEYLNKTDYLITKSYETAIKNPESPFEVPTEILTERQSARDSINTLEAEITELKVLLENETKEEKINPINNPSAQEGL